jgi:hypothetical protein
LRTLLSRAQSVFSLAFLSSLSSTKSPVVDDYTIKRGSQHRTEQLVDSIKRYRTEKDHSRSLCSSCRVSELRKMGKEKSGTAYVFLISLRKIISTLPLSLTPSRSSIASTSDSYSEWTYHFTTLYQEDLICYKGSKLDPASPQFNPSLSNRSPICFPTFLPISSHLNSRIRQGGGRVQDSTISEVHHRNQAG